MDPKLDCQKLRCCPSKYFFVDNSLSTKIMSQNHLKIEHSGIRNRCYGYRNLHTRCYLQGETLGEVSFTSIHHLWTFRVGLRCNIDNLRLFEPLSGHKTRVNDKVDLYSYLRFCGKIMCTAAPNTHLGVSRGHQDECEWFWHGEWRWFCSFSDNGGCCGSNLGGLALQFDSDF